MYLNRVRGRDMMIKVKVPATTANIGPGFDSFGMALDIYNEIVIEEIEDGIIILQEGKNLQFSKEIILYMQAL